MLPEFRYQEYTYPIPKFDLAGREVAGFIDELKVFYNEFGEFFRRSETKKTVCCI